jgi:hypothetical protein
MHALQEERDNFVVTRRLVHGVSRRNYGLFLAGLARRTPYVWAH